MSNDESVVNLVLGKVRSFDKATMNNNRFQQRQFRPIDADLHTIRSQVHVRPAIDGAMMNANRGQGQVRSTNGYLIDSVNDQG